MFRSMLAALACLFLALQPGAQSGASSTTTWAGTLDAGSMRLRLELEVTVDEEGRYAGALRSLDQGDVTMPVKNLSLDEEELSFEIERIGARFEGRLSEGGALASGTWRQGPSELPLTFVLEGSGVSAPPEYELLEAWVGELELGALRPVMQFRVVRLESGEQSVLFDSVTEGLTGMPATRSVEDGTLLFEVASVGATYLGTLDAAGTTATGTFSQGGRELALTLRRQAGAYDENLAWERRPQRPVAPFPYEAREVRFQNARDGVELAGTLTVPEGAGPHPAVVLISGSGPQDRDETIFGHKPFLVLADHLGRRGIAVLRYDDRGTGQSSGDFWAATTEDFARDASAAVDFLRGSEGIDAGRLGLVGHSEGGLIAPLVAVERGDLAAIVLLAGPGLDGAAVSLTQIAALAEAGGASAAAVGGMRTLQTAVFDALAEAAPGADTGAVVEAAWEGALDPLRAELGGELETVERTLRVALPTWKSRWFRFFLTYDPAPALRRVTCPVLALIGERDLQVLPGPNLPALRAALEASDSPDFEVAELPGLNHLFQACETGAMDEYAAIDETLNEAALERVSAWLARQLGN